jgi:hypothetical protein
VGWRKDDDRLFRNTARLRFAVIPARKKREGLATPVPDGYAAVVKAFKTDPRVAPPGAGKGFGATALKVDGKIFAMLSSKVEFVVKLPKDRAAELVNEGLGKYFDPGRGRLMKSWLVVTGGKQLWIPLAKEARDFAG